MQHICFAASRADDDEDDDEEEKVTATETVLRLTPDEVGAIDAIRAGVSALAGREVDRESAVIAAVELGLVRLAEDFELPATEDATVRRGLDAMRASWSRGNACL
ncbi:MAG: hypothetical protein ACXVPL_03180 [Actinomycetota bacterium]